MLSGSHIGGNFGLEQYEKDKLANCLYTQNSLKTKFLIEYTNKHTNIVKLFLLKKIEKIQYFKKGNRKIPRLPTLPSP